MQPNVHTEPTPQPYTILVVDDDPDLRETLAFLLEDTGYKVIEAGHAAEALSLLDEGAKPSLIVLDYNMPGMDGVELVAELRIPTSRHARIPVVMFSADDPPHVADVPLVSKSADPSVLLRVIARKLASSAASRPDAARAVGSRPRN